MGAVEGQSLAIQPCLSGAHPLVRATARMLFWVVLLLLLWWGVQWLRERSRTRPEVEGPGHIEAGGGVLQWRGHGDSDTGVGLATRMHDGRRDGSRGFGGLLLFLRHDGAIQAGEHMCDVEISGKRADARKRQPESLKQISVIYHASLRVEPRFRCRYHRAFIARPGANSGGATSLFLVGLEINVDSYGKVAWDELADDPMTGGWGSERSASVRIGLLRRGALSHVRWRVGDAQMKTFRIRESLPGSQRGLF